MKPMRTVIIGLGQMGMGYDYAQAEDDDTIITSHAQAVHLHPAYQLAGGIDPDAAKREDFTQKFGAPAFASLEDFWQEHEADLYIIAAPTQAHFTLCEQVLACGEGAILCEKPFAGDVTQASQLAAKAKASGQPLYVHYPRLFEPGTLAIKQALAAKQWGSFRKGLFYYSKGLGHNGSHAINWLLFLFGAPDRVEVIAPGRSLPNGDAEPDAVLWFGDRPVYLLAAKEEDFTLFKVELLFEKAMLSYDNAGMDISVRSVSEDPAFPDYKSLQSSADVIPNDALRIQFHVLEGLLPLLAENRCEDDPQEALHTLHILDNIMHIRSQSR